MLLFLSPSFFARSRRAKDIATSDEPSLDGGQPPHPPPAPANIRSQEEETDYRNRNSGERPVPRRAPAPLRVVLAGAGERTTLPPPTSPRSSDDSLRIRAQLRPTFACRSRDYYSNRNSGESRSRRRAPAPLGLSSPEQAAVSVRQLR